MAAHTNMEEGRRENQRNSSCAQVNIGYIAVWTASRRSVNANETLALSSAAAAVAFFLLARSLDIRQRFAFRAP